MNEINIFTQQTKYVFIQTIMCKSCVKYTVHDFIAQWYAK